jgi:hypothetical protein
MESVMQPGGEDDRAATADDDRARTTAAGGDPPDEEDLGPIVERAFRGRRAVLERFVAALRAGVPGDTTIALRGSAVAGHRHASDEPFDAGGPATSDLDVVLIGESVGRLWVDDARLLGGINTLPLSDETRWVAPELDRARARAQAIVGRPVSLQSMAAWFLELRAAVQDQPFVILHDPTR